MDAAAELVRNPVSKHQIQPEYGDEQAGTGRDCRTRLARPNSQARTGRGKISNISFLVQLTTCRIGNLTRLIHILAICVTIHKLMSKKFSPWSQGRKTPSSGRKKVGTAFFRHKENTVMIQKYSEKATSPKKQKKREKQK